MGADPVLQGLQASWRHRNILQERSSRAQADSARFRLLVSEIGGEQPNRSGGHGAAPGSGAGGGAQLSAISEVSAKGETGAAIPAANSLGMTPSTPSQPSSESPCCSTKDGGNTATAACGACQANAAASSTATGHGRADDVTEGSIDADAVALDAPAPQEKDGSRSEADGGGSEAPAPTAGVGADVGPGSPSWGGSPPRGSPSRGGPSQSTNFEHTLAEHERVEAIVLMLDSSDVAVQARAAVSLANIVPDSQFVRTAILGSDGVERLVALVSSDTHAPASVAKQHAVAALSALCSLGGYPGQLMDPADVRCKAMEAGAVEAITAGLLLGAEHAESGRGRPPTPDEQHMRAACAALIAVMADADEPIQQAFADAGALPPLVAMLALPERAFIRGWREPEVGAMLPTQAAATLSVLSAHQKLLGKMSVLGAIGPLIQLLALGLPRTREQCALTLARLLRGNTYNKKELMRLGGVEALVALLASGETADSHFYAGRALVQLSVGYEPGASLVRQTLLRLLASWPCGSFYFSVPGHAAQVRRQLRPSRVLNALATLASVPIEAFTLFVYEPLRARVIYELTPLSIEETLDIIDDEEIDYEPPPIDYDGWRDGERSPLSA